MSVILKDMYMPKSCNECRFCSDTCNGFYPYYCYLLNMSYPTCEQLKAYCPLVEIPKNHGDIVDLEVFSKFGTTVLLGAEKEE